MLSVFIFSLSELFTHSFSGFYFIIDDIIISFRQLRHLFR